MERINCMHKSITLEDKMAGFCCNDCNAKPYKITLDFKRRAEENRKKLKEIVKSVKAFNKNGDIKIGFT